MRILITGGSGFVGSNLLLRIGDSIIDKSYDPCIVDFNYPKVREHHTALRCASAIIEKDFIDKYILDKIISKKFDVVIHLAAQPSVPLSVEEPAFTDMENVQKTVRLLEACVGNVKRFVFASSSAVYGDAASPQSEQNSKLEPASPYGIQKMHVEDYLRWFGREKGLSAVALRFFNIYGPHQRHDGPYPNVIAKWSNQLKEDNEITLCGDGSQTRDFVYIEDVVDAIMAAATSEHSEISDSPINIGSGLATRIGDIPAAMAAVLGREVKVSRLPARPGDVQHTQAEIYKAKEVLGWEPRTSFSDGLRKTLEWEGLLSRNRDGER